MSDIDELIARIESASEGSGELSWAIAEMLGWAKFWEGQTIWVRPGPLADQVRRDPNSISIFDEGVDPGDFASAPPNYTTSLDAALTLVPAGKWWIVGAGRLQIAEKLYGAFVHREGEFDDEGDPICEGAGESAGSPALALCVAALKARKAAAT